MNGSDDKISIFTPPPVPYPGNISRTTVDGLILFVNVEIVRQNWYNDKTDLVRFAKATTTITYTDDHPHK